MTGREVSIGARTRSRTRSRPLGAALALVAAATVVAGAGPGLDLSWRTIDGGGTLHTAGGSFTLSGTIGQHDASGALSGGSFTIIGGFWAAEGDVPVTCTADLDDDGMVATSDLLIMLGAWGADPGGPPDLDGDDTVATGDLLILLAAWGPCP